MILSRVQRMEIGFLFVTGILTTFSSQAEEPKKPVKPLPFPGEVFEVAERTAFLIVPAKDKIAEGKPWVWYAPTLPGLPATEETWMFQKFLDAGIAIAGIDVGESYGSPAGRKLYSALYQDLTEKRGWSRKPGLLARSRGGLMLYSWAVEYPESVGCIAGIYPVCNLASYPGIETASRAYGLTAQQLTADLAAHNPVDRVASLAKAKVPIFHLQGDNDKTVPLEANSGLLEKNLRKHDGVMTLSIVKNGGHDMSPGWFQSTELVEFVIKALTKTPQAAQD